MTERYKVIALFPTIDGGEGYFHTLNSDDKDKVEKSVKLAFKLGSRHVIFIDNLTREHTVRVKPEK